MNTIPQDPYYGYGMNLYNAPMHQAADTIKYRLEGEDRLTSVVDTLRGGVREIKNNVKTYNDDQRLMNELGIQRVRMTLEAGVNKINHLTKYKDQDRIFQQIKSIMRDFIMELGLDMKKWAPNAKIEQGVLVNPLMDKVRNKRLVVQLVENALLQSMLRADAGFEADITGKNFTVSENRNVQPVAPEYQDQQGGFLRGFSLFGRR